MDFFSVSTVRKQCERLFSFTEKGQGDFHFHEDKISDAAKLVIAEIEKRYPDLKIPIHARSNHFSAGGIDRLERLMSKIGNFDSTEKSKIFVDLTIPSVLLDAGAGEEWKWYEEESGQKFNRSEGLAVASYYLFILGMLSRDRDEPFRVDAKILQELKVSDLENHFQVKEGNRLAGIGARCQLLNSLGSAVKNSPEKFGDQRLGSMVEFLKKTKGLELMASDLLRFVLETFGSIWPGRIEIGGRNLGDTWHHPLLGNRTDETSLVPFHKLSQWLTYSLIGPLELAGITIKRTEELTGLPEYRNGGLFLDTQILVPKNSENFKKTHDLSSPFIVEWRAATVILLDRLRTEINRQKPKWNLSLPQVLEGGSWWAGRTLAQKRGGKPPLNLNLEGTIF